MVDTWNQSLERKVISDLEVSESETQSAKRPRLDSYMSNEHPQLRRNKRSISKDLNTIELEENDYSSGDYKRKK